MTAPAIPGLDGPPVPPSPGTTSPRGAGDQAAAGKRAPAAAAPRVVGLDLSLTSTGCADGTNVSTFGRKGKNDESLRQRRDRIDVLAKEILEFCGTPGLACIEQAAYGASGGHAHDRSGLWWLVVNDLLARGVTVVDIIPQHVKMYATGKGVGSKDAVLAATVRRYLDVGVGNNNEADAHVLAAMGLRHLGHPIDDLPLTHLRAMAKVAWPTVDVVPF